MNNEDSVHFIQEPYCNLSSYTDKQRYYVNIVRNINHGNINPNGKLAIQPEQISIRLHLHQQRLLYEMIQKEKMKYRTSSGINMGVISDKVGSGKSISILALISNNKCVEDSIYKNKVLFKPQIGFNGFDYENGDIINTNLIIVPHNIYSQWVDYIEQNTKLKYYGISNKYNLEKMDVKRLSDYDIVLIKSTKYSEFMKIIYQDNKLEYEFEKFEPQIFETIDGTQENEIRQYIHQANNNLFDRNIGDVFLENLQIIKEKLMNIDFDKTKQKKSFIGNYILKQIKKIRGPIFQRVIIDEADSIKIPNCPCAIGKFNWFITSSVNNLLFPSGIYHDEANYVIGGPYTIFVKEILGSTIKGIQGHGFIKDVFQSNCQESFSQITQEIFLKNNDQFIEDSFNLPKPIINKIECHTPKELKMLKDTGLIDVINALNAGDNETALKMVGCNIKNENNIVQEVIHKLQKDFDVKNEKIKEKNIYIESLVTQLQSIPKENIEEINDLKSKKNSAKKSLENYKEQSENLKYKINSLIERVTNSKDKDCPICTDKVNTPILTPCCKNIFCLHCITQSINYSKKNKCPMCREKLILSDVTNINNNPENEIEKETENINLPTKLQSLIEIIKNNPNGKFLIFSEYEKSFTDLINELQKNEITYNNICGSSGQIANVIKKYKTGEIKTLLLNAKYYGSGMNLQMSSDIIIYHKMTKELEAQIIGRGQRLGRTEPLKVHHLCYDNELI